MKVNINDYVIINLTSIGANILKERHRLLYNGIKARAPQATVKTPEEYNAMIDDKMENHNGEFKMVLWDVMNTFGQYCSMGQEVPFSTIIEIPEK